MADISKIKIPAGTTYNMKDATARSNINKIINKTTKLAYGDELSVSGSNLSLLDPNDHVLSTVSLPGGLPELPLTTSPVDVQQAMALRGTHQISVDQPITEVYWENPYVACELDASLSNAAWKTSYSLSGTIPAYGSIPFALAVNCGDTQYMPLTDYKHVEMDASSTILGTWNPVIYSGNYVSASSITTGFNDVRTITSYGSFKEYCNVDEKSIEAYVRKDGKDPTMYDFNVIAGIFTYYVGSAAYRVIVGDIYNLTSSSKTNLSFKPIQLAKEIVAHNVVKQTA